MFLDYFCGYSHSLVAVSINIYLLPHKKSSDEEEIKQIVEGCEGDKAMALHIQQADSCDDEDIKYVKNFLMSHFPHSIDGDTTETEKQDGVSPRISEMKESTFPNTATKYLNTGQD